MSNDSTITIYLNKGYTTIIDRVDADLADFDWRVQVIRTNTYTSRRIMGDDGKQITIHLHRVILERMISRNLLANEVVDHINHDGLDNRRQNLRVATFSQNSANSRKIAKRGTSIYKGVMKLKDGRFSAEVVCKHKRHRLGIFKTEVEAAIAYNLGATQMHGEFACVNDIEGWQNAEISQYLLTTSDTKAEFFSGAGESRGGKGVHWRKSKKVWRVRLTRHRKDYYGGEFADYESALKASEELRKKLDG